MDHSVRGYLGRRTTEELCFAFHCCLNQKEFLFYEHIAVMCIEELASRLSPNDPTVIDCRLSLEECKNNFIKKNEV